MFLRHIWERRCEPLFELCEEGYSVASGLLRRRKVPANSICFHCQQAGEKLLKAVLQENGIRFGKTHDLEEILSLCVGPAPEPALLLDDVTLLGDYAVRYRYPGIRATKTQACNAFKAARRVCAAEGRERPPYQ